MEENLFVDDYEIREPELLSEENGLAVENTPSVEAEQAAELQAEPQVEPQAGGTQAEGTEAKGTQTERLEAEESETSGLEGPTTKGPQEDGPQVDYVQLASIMKDFHTKDPVFAGCPDYMVAIIKEMLELDFLLVLGRGLGLGNIVRVFLAKIKRSSPNALVLVLGNQEDESDPQPDESSEAIGFGVSAPKRVKMYSKGGIYKITAPITVVDILTNTLEPLNVSGLVITNAERISQHSPAAFAIRLLKQRNPRMFVKALSESPERLVMQPPLPLRLRILAVPTIMLWPRFHLVVDRSLPKLDVDEVIVEQPESVRRQQALLSELFQAVLSDIKRRVPHLDVDYLSPALGAQQQQPHANPDQSHETTTVDSVLATPDLAWRIRNALQSVWHQLSRDGKRSVHALGTLAQLQHTLTQHNSRNFREQLEYCRKDSDQPWVYLAAADMLAAEARTAAVLNRVPAKFAYLRNILQDIKDGRRVLIVCESSKTVLELEIYLQTDPQTEQDEERLREIEEELTKKDEEEAKRREQERIEQVNQGRPGRRRVRGGKSAQMTRSESQTPPQPDSQDPQDPLQPTQNLRENSLGPFAAKRNAEVLEIYAKRRNVEGSILVKSELDRLNITISTFRSHNLTTVQPQHVVLYDPDLPFTRELERYSCTHSDVEVHFMYYQRSVEELQYLAIMRREKDAFTRLIREKGLMPMVLRDEGEEFDQPEMRLVTESGAGSARRTYATNKRQRVVVDTREFRSALPFFVWQQKMDVVPLTLLVGDYVLTPEIVVERKSINDLVGSFRNGRLYEQCESMLKHYRIAVLLVEFDGPSHFSMEPFREIRSRASNDVQREIQENISALLLKFPKLKLMWSSSPLHSAQIFRGLKEAEPEPEPAECAMAGQSVLYESVALSMLEALPGITSGNAPLLANIASTMAEICELTEEQLTKTLGPENGGRLYRFINKDSTA